MRIFLCLFVLLACAGVKATDDDRLERAYALAKKQEAAAAIELYRAALAEGQDSAGLRYNLGTLCLEQGDLGCAVLHLRSAERLDPSDEDVRHNLALALAARTDRLADTNAEDPLRALGRRTPPTLARVALAVPLALLGLLLGGLAFAQGRTRTILRTCATVCGVAVLCGAALYLCRLRVERAVELVVLVGETPARKDPDPDATVTFTAHAGLHGERVDEEQGFVRLRFDNGLDAWIARDHLGEVGATP